MKKYPHKKYLSISMRLLTTSGTIRIFIVSIVLLCLWIGIFWASTVT